MSFLVEEEGTNCMTKCTEAKNAKTYTKDPSGFYRVVFNRNHSSEETGETKDEEDVFFHDYNIALFCFAKEVED